MRRTAARSSPLPAAGVTASTTAGWAASVILNSSGARTPLGSWPSTRGSSVFTLVAAVSMSMPYSNSTATADTWSREVEVTRRTPSMADRRTSMGWVTSVATSLAVAPGHWVTTDTVGRLVSGNRLSGSWR